METRLGWWVVERYGGDDGDGDGDDVRQWNQPGRCGGSLEDAEESLKRELLHLPCGGDGDD